MTRQHGSTLLELVTILAISAVLCAIAVPGAAAVRSVFAADAAADRLALLLRDAQARAQARGVAVRVSVDGDGSYSVRDMVPSGDGTAACGELGAPSTATIRRASSSSAPPAGRRSPAAALPGLATLRSAGRVRDTPLWSSWGGGA